MTDYKKYINALRKCAKEHDNDRTPTFNIRVSDLCRDTANLLEEVEQEPKTGHWIEDAGTYYKAIHERGCEPDENTPIFLDDIACSECLAKFSVIDNETERFKCCPNCGAKMVEPQEGGDQE